MEKVTIKINEIDPILKIPRPTWLPKNWYKENKNPFDYFSELDRPFFEDEEGRERFNLNALKFCDFEFTETPISNYFYIINTLPFDFFEKRIFYRYIDDKVLSDVENGKCKIIFYMDDDGHWGEKLPYFFDNMDIEQISFFTQKYNLKKDDVYFISHNCALEDNSDNYDFTPITCGAFSNKLPEGERNKYSLYVNHHHCDYITDENFSYDLDKVEKTFLTYNNRCKPHRFYLIYSMIKNNLLKDSLYSYTGFGDSIYFMENKTKINWYLVDKGRVLLNDNILNDLQKITGTKIITSEINGFGGDYYGQFLQIEDFEKTFVSVVTESTVGDNSIYFSEKTQKPLLAKHPFILVSSKGSLKKLKSYGFKTFDKWWDESYDECNYFIGRIDKISEIMKDLQKKSKKELIQMREEMKEVLLHNHNLLQTYSTTAICDVLKNIKFS